MTTLVAPQPSSPDPSDWTLVITRFAEDGQHEVRLNGIRILLNPGPYRALYALAAWRKTGAKGGKDYIVMSDVGAKDVEHLRTMIRRLRKQLDEQYGHGTGDTLIDAVRTAKYVLNLASGRIIFDPSCDDGSGGARHPSAP